MYARRQSVQDEAPEDPRGRCTCGQDRQRANHLVGHGLRRRPSTYQVDPTRTTQLRKRFVGAFNRRWGHLIKLIRQSVITNDCFGLRPPRRLQRTDMDVLTVALPPEALAGQEQAEQVDRFGEWLSAQTDALILEERRGEYWYAPYLALAYYRGIGRARSQVAANRTAVRRLGLTPGQLGTTSFDLQAASNLSHHRRAANVIKSQVLTDLKGITSAMDAQIKRELVAGLMEGQSALDLSKRLVDRVEKVSEHRATLLARTEIIRAHHIATIDEYGELGIEGVEVIAEWVTAGDARVCDICRPRHGRTYPLDVIRSMIPVHPQCRCTTKPAFDFSASATSAS